MTNELKSRLSKIMTLGNKLARTMDRSAAFREAWTIIKAGGLKIAVRGVTFGNRQEALRRLSTYDPAQVRAWLVPEPENPVDPAAVSVMVMVNGGRGAYCLGYVPREQTGTAAVVRGRASVQVLPGTTYGARVALAI
jgi:hypothetical protein